MAPLGLVVTTFLPAGIQFFFLATGALQYLQSWLFFQPWLRSWARLPPLVRYKDVKTTTDNIWNAPSANSVTQSPAAASTNMLSSIQDGIKSVRERVDKSSEKNRLTREREKAQQYEEKRSLEEKEKSMRRRENRMLRKSLQNQNEDN
jgi:YidC/Oxa1 family membrane protein insertase